MSHTLRALWHVETKLDNVSKLPRMDVTATPSDGAYAISINGKPKKVYTLSGPGIQDFALFPHYDSACRKLWKMYNHQLNSIERPSMTSNMARCKAEVVQAKSTSDDRAKDVVPASNPLLPGQQIINGEVYGPAPIARSSAPNHIEAAAKAWSTLTGNREARNRVTPATTPVSTDEFIRDGRASGDAPVARFPASSPGEIEGAAKAWSSLTGRHEANKNVTPSTTDSKSMDSATNTISIGAQMNELRLTSDGPTYAPLASSAGKLEPVKSTLKSTYNQPAPNNTMVSTSDIRTELFSNNLLKAFQERQKILESYRARNLSTDSTNPSQKTRAASQHEIAEPRPSKNTQTIFDADKINAMKTVPEPPTLEADSVNGDEVQETQVWENVDIADEVDDKEWDLIDSKEITGIENREKAEAKVTTERGGWTGTIRRGLFG